HQLQFKMNITKMFLFLHVLAFTIKGLKVYKTTFPPHHYLIIIFTINCTGCTEYLIIKLEHTIILM
ncbi:hypothetical protein BMT00_08650, partial [Leuconostoc mesenteroides subsp. mesenteroides]